MRRFGTHRAFAVTSDLLTTSNTRSPHDEECLKTPADDVFQRGKLPKRRTGARINLQRL
ncbi:MAG: hypothetical protein M5U25_11435 [Planctomycetota bacterium]|nr:hypothetical protein [Planctomycetota bacterium]